MNPSKENRCRVGSIGSSGAFLAMGKDYYSILGLNKNASQAGVFGLFVGVSGIKGLQKTLLQGLLGDYCLCLL